MTTPHNPPLTPNDPRLTAFALGESDPQETDAIAAAVAADPALQAEVDAIRATAIELDQHFASQPAPRLDDQARERIQAAAQPRRPLPWIFGGVALAAAALALAVILMPWNDHSPSQDLAVHHPATHADDEKALAAKPQAPTRDRPVEDLNVVIERGLIVEEPVVLDLSASVEDLSTEDARSSHVAEAQGREEAVTSTESGGSGAFAAIGTAGGATGSLGRRELTDRLGRGQLVPAALPAVAQSESYQAQGKNPFRSTAVPGGDASTFAIDVDTASYTLTRRMLLQQNRLPPSDAVRVEEFINYFRYAYTPPEKDSEQPFAVNAEVVAAPWQPEHRLVRVGIQGKTVSHAERPASNLVFLIDVSGSMRPNDRLPLAQRAFPHMVAALDERDSVAIVTYANGVGIALPPTPGNQHQQINATIQGLRAAGGTAGGAGLAKAYRLAQEQFIKGGVNRVILVTDGDFNVGVTDHGSLVDTVRHYAEQGIRITVLGVGTGNLHDDRIEVISNRGNGIYRYLDSDREAQRVFTDGLIGDLVTIASDVKTQVFFNPSQVAGWRLIGYQNRRLAREDFNDDSVDAGDIGAGHQVTALYEIIPAGLPVPASDDVDPNPFVPSAEAPQGSDGPMLRLRLRHKIPDSDTSALQEFDLHDQGRDWDAASPDTQWAVSVAAFAMALRNDPFIGGWHWSQIREAAEASGLSTADPQREEFLRLIERAERLRPVRPQPREAEQREAPPNDLTPAP
ncbi:MAG: DUF3520 domain-containing protein [Planctomycetota bacterium]|nr:MAG: DUF3520 domain-containing protein [Planctomycetota bacterium]